ncbi:hypothetical protein FRC01_005723 [Tulasnella sp. 417]|nr:hypothetical protein FRC01_005723 [Tulasnella sp. 417]
MTLSVGKSIIYARSGTFPEAVGLKQKSLEVVGYPAVSATSSTTELSSQTTIEIKPGFDAFYGGNSDAWEEYIEHTMVEGLAATGMFISTAVAVVSLRKKLLKRYPGLEADDASERGRAVGDFLCDFVVDMGPIQPARDRPGEVANTTPKLQSQLTEPDDAGATTEPSSPASSEEETKKNSATDPSNLA